jgi:Uma2 family endonuclease
MSTVAVAERMTAEQYLALGEPLEGRTRTQLIGGEVVVNEPTPLHGFVQRDLLAALIAWTRAAAGRGAVMLPLDVVLDEHNVYAPDVLWYAEGRAPDRHAEPPSPMPDLAIEVRSPSTWRFNVGAKKTAYDRCGLRELWLVDTAAEAVLVFRRTGRDALGFDVALEVARDESLASPLLPGFALALVELFPAS